MRSFYYSVPKLFLSATAFAALGALTCWIGTLVIGRTAIFLGFVFIAGIDGWLLIRVIRMLSRADAPAVILLSDRISFDSLLHRTEIPFEAIKAVSVLRPGSEQIGNRLHFELHPRTENGQRRWRSHTISLALLSATSADIASAVESHLAAFQAASATPFFKRTPEGAA